MAMKRMSKTIVSKIEQNLRPLSTNLASNQNLKSGKQIKNPSSDLPIGVSKIDIDETYRIIKQNAVIDNKANVEIITCLKAAHKNWEQYMNNPNKNGQLACTYEMKLKRIQMCLSQKLSKLIITGQPQKIRQASDLLKPILQHLQKKSRKYKQHQTQFKILSRRSQQEQDENYQKDEQIKQEMSDLVTKFKKYAINISQNLNNDTAVIKQIGQNQDKQLNSLQGKNSAIESIIKEQKLGFIQLLWMGVVAIIVWILGLAAIIII